VNFKYACNLEGVYRDANNTYVTSTYASTGDLFSVALAGLPPGPDRESAFAPVVSQLLRGVKQLHDLQIVHGDISLENVLLTKSNRPNSEYEVKIIDFGMASTSRMVRHCVRGKSSYQAPEMHGDDVYDAFLTDTFSVGVIAYALFFKEYPWMTTLPEKCKNFGFIAKFGFSSFFAKRNLRGSTTKIAECTSQPLLQLLEGMLTLDPQERLTFGEKGFDGRKSVWDEPWMKSHVPSAYKVSL